MAPVLAIAPLSTSCIRAKAPAERFSTCQSAMAFLSAAPFRRGSKSAANDSVRAYRGCADVVGRSVLAIAAPILTKPSLRVSSRIGSCVHGIPPALNVSTFHERSTRPCKPGLFIREFCLAIGHSSHLIGAHVTITARNGACVQHYEDRLRGDFTSTIAAIRRPFWKDRQQPFLNPLNSQKRRKRWIPHGVVG